MLRSIPWCRGIGGWFHSLCSFYIGVAFHVFFICVLFSLLFTWRVVPQIPDIAVETNSQLLCVEWNRWLCALYVCVFLLLLSMDRISLAACTYRHISRWSKEKFSDLSARAPTNCVVNSSARNSNFSNRIEITIFWFFSRSSPLLLLSLRYSGMYTYKLKHAMWLLTELLQLYRNEQQQYRAVATRSPATYYLSSALKQKKYEENYIFIR